MRKIYIAKDSNKTLQDYLRTRGYALEYVSSQGLVDPAISCHPDVFLCKLGVTQDAPLFFARKGDLAPGYPTEAAFNAACTGKYFIHNLKITNHKLLEAVKSAGMELIHVQQGYAKCSTVIVDEQSIITYDKGIAWACGRHPALSVLLVTPGHVHLNGYNSGFIGGASGRIGEEVIFNGDLSAHPDFASICQFIQDRNLKCVWFPDYPLTDIGSIL